MKRVPTQMVLTALIICLQGCSEKLDRAITQQLASPDGKLVATVFTKEGDATLPLMVDVYLGAKDDPIPAYGNVFRGNGSEDARVMWKDRTTLVITTDAEPFLLMKEYAGVKFELRSGPR